MKFERPEKLSNICELINGNLMGNNHIVYGVNEVPFVEEGDITYAENKKYFDKAITSKASSIITNSNIELQAIGEKSLIFVSEPLQSFNKILENYFPSSKQEEHGYDNLSNYKAGKNTFIDNSARLQRGVKIGENSIIYANVYLGYHVVIGDNCVIYPGCVIYDSCIIGNKVIIHANTVIGSDAFCYSNLANKNQKRISKGKVLIGNDVEIGSNVTIDKGVTNDTIIRNNTKIDNLVQIGHGVEIGTNVVIASQTGIAGEVKIGNNVTIWGQCGINKQLIIGDNSVINAKSGLDRNVPPNATYFGIPALNRDNQVKFLRSLYKAPLMFKQMEELNISFEKIKLNNDYMKKEKVSKDFDNVQKNISDEIFKLIEKFDDLKDAKVNKNDNFSNYGLDSLDISNLQIYLEEGIEKYLFDTYSSNIKLNLDDVIIKKEGENEEVKIGEIVERVKEKCLFTLSKLL